MSTLQRHRSKLLPDVEYGLDGTVFVTDDGGTFPMRGKQKGQMTPDDYNSFRSLDRNRNEIHRGNAKPKQYTSRYAHEVQNLPDTISTRSGNTLGRRLKQQSRRSSGGGRRYGTLSSSGTAERRLRGGTPKMPAEYTASLTLRKHRKARAHDDRLSSASDEKPKKYKTNPSPSKRNSLGRPNKMPAPLTNNEKKFLAMNSPEAKKEIMSIPRARTLAEERIPYVVFLVNGIVLLMFGVANALVSWWHLYYCAIWSAILVLILGILGAAHKGNYLTKSRNGVYIFFGVVTTAAVMVSSGFVMKVLTPLIKGVAMATDADVIINSITFTNQNKSLAGISMDEDAQVYTSMALHIGALLLLLVNYFSLSATMIALVNHWDAMYCTTAECSHRGRPRLFNPLEQISVGQATSFFGLVCIFSTTAGVEMYWSPVWAAGAIMLAGLFSLFYGKRIDKTSLGILAIIMQLLALGACGVALTFVSLAMVDDVNMVYPDRVGLTDDAYRERLASICFEAVYLLTMVVNIVFSIGVLFRICRKICCGSCMESNSDT